jgi:hypothetical protein|nr:MAG TPA: hypothetical protein [Caudoviricetes sp.]
MSAKHLENPVTLTIEAADVFYLREFLYEESISAEVDFENVETMHNDRVRQAAKIALSRERTKMTKIIDVLDAALDAADVRDRLAKKIASMSDPLQAADEVGTETEEGK